MSGMLKSIRKRKRQTFLSLLLAACLCVAFLFGTVAEASNSDFGINVTIKASKKNYTFELEVKNKSKAFDGRVVVMTSSQGSGFTGYSKSISIASQQTEYVSINVPLVGTNPDLEFKILILDNDDILRYQEKFKSIAYIAGKNLTYEEKITSLDMYDIENVQGYMEKPAGELSGLISILIILYVVLVGPIIYLILKAVKKRELMWIIIPGITVVFVLIMFLMSIGSASKNDSIKSIELTNYQNETISTYVFGYSAGHKKWDVKTKENYCTGRCLSRSYIYDENVKYRAELEQGLSNMKLHYSPRNSYESTCFELESETKPEGSIEIIASENDPYVVKVCNKTGQHLDYMYVSTFKGCEVVEDVEPNATVDVELNLNNNSSGSFINNSQLQNKYLMPAYEDGDIEKSSELAALYIALEASYTGNEQALAVGVTKGASKTDKEEISFRCFYDSVSFQPYDEY